MGNSPGKKSYAPGIIYRETIITIRFKRALVLTNKQQEKEIFNLNFLENALIEFLKTFPSGRPTQISIAATLRS